MSAVIEPSALWQALQDVDDGQEPAEVYARVMGEVNDIESIEEELFQQVEDAHDHDQCDARHDRGGIGYCPGITCVNVGGVRLTVDCPCKCHEGEVPE